MLDTHVLLSSGSVDALLRLLSKPEHCKDMVHGPLVEQSGQRVIATEMLPVFRGGMYGIWHVDPRGEDPASPAFEITMQGLGTFAMRRDAWPGLNPWFRGFGGEEGYIHKKVRNAGGRVLCLPALRWQHRFLRPRGTPYPNTWEDRINNYIVGWNEIRYDLTPLVEHLADHVGPDFGKIYSQVMREVAHPLRCVDGIVILSDDDRVAPWSETKKDLADTGIEAVREPVVASGSGRVADVALALDNAAMKGLYRGWSDFLILDESWSLDIGFAHALNKMIRVADKPDLCDAVVFADAFDVPEGSGAFLPGPIWATTTSCASASGLEEWVGRRKGKLIPSVLPLGRKRDKDQESLADMLGSVFIAGFCVDDDTSGASLRRRFEGFGLAAETHRLRLIDRPGVSVGSIRRRDISSKLLSLGEHPIENSGHTLFVGDDVWLIMGAGTIMVRALLEASLSPWDVLCLSGKAGSTEAEFLSGHTILCHRYACNVSSAFIVNQGSIEKVGNVLACSEHDAEQDPMGVLFDDADSSDELIVLAVEPTVFATIDLLRENSPQASLRHRFERP